jgi:hypothetical protein
VENKGFYFQLVDRDISFKGFDDKYLYNVDFFTPHGPFSKERTEYLICDFIPKNLQVEDFSELQIAYDDDKEVIYITKELFESCLNSIRKKDLISMIESNTGSEITTISQDQRNVTINLCRVECEFLPMCEFLSLLSQIFKTKNITYKEDHFTNKKFPNYEEYYITINLVETDIKIV